jgi:MscS family membrane protein
VNLHASADDELWQAFALIVVSYVAARFVSYLFGKLIERSTRRTDTDLDDRLLSALKRPITYLLFLSGSWLAVARLPEAPTFMTRIGDALFVSGVVLVTIALGRAYTILLSWYARSPRFADGDGLAVEFAPMLKRIGQLFLAVLATIAVLQRLGVNVASLVVSLGVGSLAVGLAAQDTLANMFAGFALMFDRPFRIGDRVQLQTGEIGDVLQVGMRATRIHTLDDCILIVPNSLLIKEKLVNQSQPNRHVTTRIEVAVAYGTDLAKARELLVASARASTRLDPERAPVALVTRYGEFAVHLRLVFWVRDYLEQGLASSEIHEQIARRFAEAGIQIPVPVRRIIQEHA